jgi:two-component system copper resistance phosphate regulon response regulator CusR
MKILIIEDNLSIRNVLRMSFESESFAVDEAEDGEVGSYMAKINKYDLIILDIVLPKKNGNVVCREIRERGIQTPILMLTGKNDVLSKIELLNKGADDYVTKPFSYDELLARVKALIRRPPKIEDTILRVNHIKLNTETGEVSVRNKRVYLTRKEFSLLEFLMKKQNKVISRASIMEHVWNAESDPFSNTIETHILNLRRKLGDKNKHMINSVPGRGYKITEFKKRLEAK